MVARRGKKNLKGKYAWEERHKERHKEKEKERVGEERREEGEMR